MSRKIEAIYKGKSVVFDRPDIGETVDLDFDGIALIQAINGDGEMDVTGQGMDGRGSPLGDKECNEVSFRLLP